MRLNHQTYALTTTTDQRRRVFQRTEIAELMIATILRHRDLGRFLLHGFVVMPDHSHLLITPTESIEKAAQLVTGGFSFAVRKLYLGEVWQPSYHAHRIVDRSDYDNQLGYIAQNPERKRLVAYPFVHTTGAWRLDDVPSSLR
jgi:putative transposase